MYPSLICGDCCYIGYHHLLTVGDDVYFNDCIHTKRGGMKLTFISTFAAFIAHQNHVDRIKLVHCQHPNEILEEHLCKSLKPSADQLVSVFHGSHHFAVMEAQAREKEIPSLMACHTNLQT